MKNGKKGLYTVSLVVGFVVVVEYYDDVFYSAKMSKIFVYY